MQNETIRLNTEPPLVLKVGAMTDFLWPSFVREMKPRVTYLADRFDIKRLSRFGKELFEFLYMGGDVDPVVSLDAVEEYFRAKQDGQSVEYPRGYKPENALWHLILEDVMNSPVYHVMQRHCLGDHFNSGNNAVNILNELGQVIEKMLGEDTALTDALAEKGEQLEQIRSQFVDAMQQGDSKSAAELRAKGKQIGEEMEEILNALHKGKQASIQKGIEKAHEDAVDQQNAMSKLAGNGDGFGHKLDNIDDKIKLAKKIQNSRFLKLFIDRLGAFKAAWTQRKRERTVKSNYSNIVGAELSNNITKTFPSELALAATEEGKALFALKYAQKTMLCKDFEAQSKNVQQGPVVMYVDVSGSMHGDDELWSKALTYCVVEECTNNNRPIYVRLFNSTIADAIDIEPNTKDSDDMLKFIMKWGTSGGTSFNRVMVDARQMKPEMSKADILIITDGECEVEDRHVREFNKFVDSHKIDVRGFCIGKKSESMEKFCDEVVLVNTSNDAEMSEVFQKAIG